MKITADFRPSSQVSDNITRLVQQLIASYHTVDKWEQNQDLCLDLWLLFGKNGAQPQSAQLKSIHFVVLVTSDEDRFLGACRDGSLANDLTKLLVVPELEKEAGVKLEVVLTINQSMSVQTVTKEDPLADRK